MAEELFVDTSRLEIAAGILRNLALPSAPAPVTVVGTDAVSAAINAAMPVVESPAITGLPAVGAALVATAENMAAAARMYVETDAAHGAALGRSGAQLERRELLSTGAGRTASRALGATAEPDAPASDRAAGDREVPAMPSGAAGVMTGVQGAISSIQGAVSSAQGSAGSVMPIAGADDDDDEAPTEAGAAAPDDEGTRAPLWREGVTASDAPTYRGTVGS